MELFGVTGPAQSCNDHDRCDSLKGHTRCLPSDLQTHNIARITQSIDNGVSSDGFIRFFIILERAMTLLLECELIKPECPANVRQ